MSVAASLADVLPAEALSEPREPGSASPLGAIPEAVVHPESPEQVAATIEWACANGLGVLPMASGRRVRRVRRGRPFLALRTDRMRGIEIYEPADLTLTAGAGTSVAEIAERLGAHGQWLPFDPPMVGERSIGGLAATGESGPAAMGYGELRNHVLGMTVVTGDARVLRLGGRVVKNVAGYDLLKPLVGSRGRLAVVASVCVRAFPEPAEDRVLVRTAGSAHELCGVAKAIGTAPTLPVSSVLLAPATALSAGAAILVRLHGAGPTVEADQRALERHCGVSFERSEDSHGLLEGTRDHACSDSNPILELSVLPSELPAALEGIADELGEVELLADTYSGRVRIAAPALEASGARRLRDTVEALGGALAVRPRSAAAGREEDSGDWSEVASRLSDAEAELVEGLERVFDPHGVLWPCRV